MSNPTKEAILTAAMKEIKFCCASPAAQVMRATARKALADIAALPAQEDAQAVAWQAPNDLIRENKSDFISLGFKESELRALGYISVAAAPAPTIKESLTGAAAPSVQLQRYAETDSGMKPVKRGEFACEYYFADEVDALLASPSVQGESIDSDGHFSALLGGMHPLSKQAVIAFVDENYVARTAAPSLPALIEQHGSLLKAANAQAQAAASDPYLRVFGVASQAQAAPSEGLAIPAAGCDHRAGRETKCTRCGSIHVAGEWRAPATEQAKPELAGLPRVWGVSRDAESPGGKGVLVAFDRPLTDDELRALPAILAAQPVPQASGERDAALREAIASIRALDDGEAPEYADCVEAIQSLISGAATTSKPTGSQG